MQVERKEWNAEGRKAFLRLRGLETYWLTAMVARREEASLISAPYPSVIAMTAKGSVEDFNSGAIRCVSTSYQSSAGLSHRDGTSPYIVSLCFCFFG